MDNTKLFVGNLPWSLTHEALVALFAEVGEVLEAVIITDKFSGKSKGFGFVTMADDATAQKAIEMLNGKEVEGRAIVVNVARPKREDA